MAREIARIVGATKREEGYFEGGGYAVTWAFGHLVQLAMPDGYGIRGFVRDNLPVIPDSFTLIPRQVKAEKGYKPDSGVVAQIKTITRLFNDSEQIIVATDAGREGELIFRYLYHYIGCATPFVRLWISSLTDKVKGGGVRLKSIYSTAVGFGMWDLAKDITQPCELTLYGKISYNHFNGSATPQIELVGLEVNQTASSKVSKLQQMLAEASTSRNN